VLTYKLTVFTGDLPDAGTSANFHAMLVGERGDTGYRKLLQSLSASNKEESFQQGQVCYALKVKINLSFLEGMSN
jgi:PLAT/LH2 domain